MIVNAELGPVASSEFEAGPPDKDAVELARVVDRGIRESHCIDFEKLCIKANEKVWMVNVDITVLDHDGNLIDASALGAMAAIMNAKIPKYDIETNKIDYTVRTDAMPLTEKPVEVTVFKIGSKLFVDATLEEEKAIDARLTIATMENENLCAMQKGGIGFFTTPEIEKAVDIAIDKGKELRGML